jgi:hypothetical protein
LGFSDDLGRQWAVGRDETHRDRVDAVTRVFLGQLLSKKNVSEVSVAILAQNLNPEAIRIPLTPYRPR